MDQQLSNYLDKLFPFSEEEKKQILSLIQLRSYRKCDFLLEIGHKTQNSYLVIQGCLRSYYVIDGEEKTSELFLEEDVITPICSMDHSPSEYHIICQENCLLLISNPKLEESGFALFPQFETMCRLMSEQSLARKQQELNRFKLSNPEERYRALLFERPELIQRFPQHQIASYLGILPQSLSRIRKRLTSKK